MQKQISAKNWTYKQKVHQGTFKIVFKKKKSTQLKYIVKNIIKYPYILILYNC